MKISLLRLLTLAVFCALGALLFIVLRQRNMAGVESGTYRSSWSSEAASSYLEGREAWWQKWPTAQMDHGTVCVSCHTVVPYAMVQPGLRRQMGEKAMTAPEETMLESIEKRVSDWNQVSPFYSDAAGPGKGAESRSTEAVLNAVILANYDAASGQLQPETRMAFDEAWALQERSGDNAGAWKWQNFHLAPWESNESAYQGAALFAVALGSTPGDYMNDDRIRDGVDRLRQYLRGKYSSQSTMAQLYVLWASAKMPGLLSDGDRNALIARVEELQRPDGGWALSAMDGPDGLKRIVRARWNLLTHPSRSDGCATGLAVIALQAGKVRSDDAAVQRGLKWLNQDQEKDGSWWATSLNGSNDMDSDTALFMQDAATGYAVLALQTAKLPGSAGDTAQGRSGAEPASPRKAGY